MSLINIQNNSKRAKEDEEECSFFTLNYYYTRRCIIIKRTQLNRTCSNQSKEAKKGVVQEE